MNAYIMKGTKVPIQNDYSKETLRRRNLVWENAKNKKLQGNKVTHVHDKFHVDKKKFAWDDTTSSRIQLALVKTAQSAHDQVSLRISSSDS